MRQILLFVLLSSTFSAAFSQPFDDPKFKQKFNKASALMFDGAFMDAMVLFEDLYAYDTTNANLNYHLGVCYLFGKKDHALAIKRLESATQAVSLEYVEGDWKERRAPGITYYNLGKAYHFKNQFERAVANYYSYRSFIELDDVETYNQVRQQIQWAENAMELVKIPVGVKVTNLGPDINTKYPEYCPIVSADGKVLIFTSRREGGTSELKDLDGQFYEDIYVCQRQPDGKWGMPKSIGTNINSAGHEAAIGLSPDGQMLFIYKDDNNDGNVYFSKKNGDEWTKPEKLGSDINTTAWETHASVNATQDLLIFVSNRNEGGFGGRDLWYCKKLPNGEWGMAQNMGSGINSQFEEDSPFISADGNTLIFSSQGHTSMGGFDIFRSELVDGVWSVPENIGYPINTSEDDVFFILTPDGRTAYYSSRMDGGFGDTDLYKLLLEVKKQSGAAVARGVMKVPAMAYADISAKIVVTDEGGAPIGTYRPNNSSGYYVLILGAGETYTVTYEADGYKSVVAKVPVSQSDVYAEYDGVIELEEVVFGENILALQKETERLNKEKEEAEAKAAQEAKLAEETAARAKQQAEQDALARAKDAEKKKAEELALKEKEDAASALAAEQERVREAEFERKKIEAKAKLETQQADAARLKAEEEAKASEASKLEAEELAKAKQAEDLKAKEQARAAEIEKAENEAKEAVQAKSDEEARLVAEAKAAEAKAKEEALAQAKAEEEERSKALELAELEKGIQQEQAQKERAELEAKELASAKVTEPETTHAEPEVENSTAQRIAEIQEQAKEKEAKEAKEAKETQAIPVVETNSTEELAAKQAQEEQARMEAAAEEKKRQLQERIQALKEKQQEQGAVATETAPAQVKNQEKPVANEPVKEVTVQKTAPQQAQPTIDAAAIKAKREEMLARIEQLKKEKTVVEKNKVVDEQAVISATSAEQLALQKKQGLEKKSEKTKEEIIALQKALEAVEKQVASADDEIKQARAKVEEAERKLAEDIKEEKRIAEEALKKQEEAKEAERQLKELAELERQRLEQERLAAEEFEREQREEAEKTKRELIQLEAIAEQKRQVEVALQAEERKKKEMDAAEATAFSQKEKLANAVTLEQLRELNQQLIDDNLDLKRQLAVLNEKLDLILARLDYTPDIQKVEIPSSSTMTNLQQGRRLILRNIFFEYNKAILGTKSKYELNKLYEFLKQNPSVSIEVSGHTDSRGNDEYNLKLSEDRAQAVVDYLIRNGIPSSRLTAVGYGETRPIARNENADLTDNPVGRQLNRRIEISLPTGKVEGVEVEEIQVPKGARIK